MKAQKVKKESGTSVMCPTLRLSHLLDAIALILDN
jgi:hypothetical protein